MIEPHGGRLIDRTLSESHAEQVIEATSNAPEIVLDRAALQDVYNIANGRFSPLEGFLTRNDFLKVAHDMTLEDGTVWPLPVTLDIGTEKAAELTPDTPARLRSPAGNVVGVIEVEDVYKFNKGDAAEAIFGTRDTAHPGVVNFLEQGDFLVGGPIKVFDVDSYSEYDLQPAESRVLFKHRGWKTVVGFQTRNAPHRAHEYIQKSALEHVDGLFVQPKLGEKKSGDYRDDIIMGAYERLIETYYPTRNVVTAVFPSPMRYAGPREAVFDAIVRRNHGCTHFIVGRDHAGVKDFYDGFDAHRIFDTIDDLGIDPIFFNYSFYCHECDGMVSDKICPHSEDARVYPSGTEIRQTIKSGSQPSPKVMRPEVAKFIIDAEGPFITE